MKRKTNIRTTGALILALVMLLSMTVTALAATDDTYELPPGYYYNPTPGSSSAQDQSYTLACPAPWNLSELKQVVDVTNPASVAAYWVWAVTRLADNYNDGMGMMKYLFADLEPYGPGFTEGGMSGLAGWDTYFNERLDDPEYEWLPRAYFAGSSKANGFALSQPLTVDLIYDANATDTVNASTVDMGRVNFVYRVKSNAGGNQVTIHVTKFMDSDRWYVTTGASSAALYYDQRSALTEDELSLAMSTIGDTSTAEEHIARYGVSEADPNHKHNYERQYDSANHWWKCNVCGNVKDLAEHYTSSGICVNCGYVVPDEPEEDPFVDVDPDDYFYDAVMWAYDTGITTGTSDTTFGPDSTCTRAQAVTFLWRAAGKPWPTVFSNPFTDVSGDAYYYIAVLWAVEQGITDGTTATTFSPNSTCSSAHIITFLYRAFGGEGSGWYEVARQWASDAGLLYDTGMTVSPCELCPRSAVVTFLYRMFN